MVSALKGFIAKDKSSKFGALVASGPKQKLKEAESNATNETTDPLRLENVLGLEIPFETLYTLQKTLRSGSFATVWVAKHRINEKTFAVKVIDRRKLKLKDDQNVSREIEIMKELHGCDGVIKLIDFFQSPETFHVVLDLAKGGDVFDRLSKRSVYNESHARDLAINLLTTIEFIHDKGIAHRDLKPENILLVDEDDDTRLKVADFGFAKKVAEGGLTTRCGTPAFVAPEVILGIPYTQISDMWSVGAIIFFLLGGYPPFQADNHKNLFRKIRAADYVFHDKYWKGISLEAKQIISGLLTVNTAERIDADDALQHNWLKTKDQVLRGNDLRQSLIGIKHFCARRKLKGAAFAVSYAVSASFWNSTKVSFAHLSDMRSTGSAESIGAEQKKENKKEFKYNFKLLKKINGGAFSTVWEAQCLATNKIFAVKIVSRRNLTKNDDAQVLNEVSILQSLKHKSVVQLVDFFEEKDRFYLVMEYLTGGDVFDRIVERNHYTEKDARDLTRSLIEGVEFLHSHKIVHRDLKPQNLLLASEDDDAAVKIGDFGFAKRVHTPHSLITRCGTPTYVAPEILKNHPHDSSADMWSIGVILFVLLVGYPPFMEENQRALFHKVRLGEYQFFEPDWEGISEEAKELISQLLVVDPAGRLSARQALGHPWISKDDYTLSTRDLSESLSELKRYIDDNSD